MRRFTLWPTLVGLGTLIVLALFLAIVVRNVEEMRSLRDQTVGVEHSLEVQRQLDAVLLDQARLDADLRQYVLTGDPQLLAGMRADQQVAAERVGRLGALVSDNPAQEARVERLRAATDEWRVGVDRLAAMHTPGGEAPAVASRPAEDVGVSGDDLRGIITEMTNEETTLLAGRRVEADRSYRRAVNGRIGSGIVSAALLIGVVIIAGLHARSKSRREEALVKSEQRAREAATREQDARADAERANREKDQFLAVLSHELRTPLNAVLGWTQILQGAGADEATITRALASIRRNAEAQQRLVEDLLDVSRIISGKLPIEREPFDLRNAVSAAAEGIRPAAEMKGLTLVADLRPTPPATGDAGRIQQVASNLLSNAVKFTPAGGVVSISLLSQGDQALIEVSDNGEGIPPDLQPHIFERFRQGDGSMTRAHGGLGLGLAIARHIVEAHGGAIAVESGGLNAGATFRVRLPCG